MRQLKVCYSFELGGEKKTKGAALTFVSTINAPCDERAEHNSNLYSNRLPCPVVFDIGFSALAVYTIRNESNTPYAQARASTVYYSAKALPFG